MTMSALPAQNGHNEACCNIPPVVSSGYAAGGAYETLGGLQTYVTGPSNATKGLIVIYDIFGFADQTVQGADILATSDDKNKYAVLMPDFLGGDYCPGEYFPPDTPEKQQKLGAWFGQSEHYPHTAAAAIPAYLEAVREARPSITSWGIIGYCWGGKVVELVTSDGKTNRFQIAGGVHPAMVDPAGADKITVPYILLASMEEPVDTINEFQSKLQVANHVETFDDQIHGFMAARGDLSCSRVKDEYTRGYETLLKFFAKNWA